MSLPSLPAADPIIQSKNQTQSTAVETLKLF